MPYGDEEIIRTRVAAQAKKRHTIENEIEINGVKYTFARRNFEYGFSMVVPESFEMIPEDIAKRKFLSEERPKTIISSNDFRVCFLFNVNTASGNIESRLQNYRNYMKSLHPTNVFFSEAILKTQEGQHVGCYDYQYTVIDSNVYNISFFMDINDKEILGWFICPSEFRGKWEPLARQMLNSIIIAKE